MHTIQINTNNPKQVRQFLELPFRIYRDTPQWVPPIAGDARRMLDRKKHPFYKHSNAAFFLVYRESQELPTGRVAILDNQAYNQFNQESKAFFFLFECDNDPDAARALFEAGFDWARNRGLTIIHGPKGFTALDSFGLLVEGFEHRPALGIPYNHPYYPSLVEAAGFEGVAEVVSGYLDETMIFPADIHRASELIKKRRGLHVARFTKRSELRAFVPHLKELYNHALRGTSGNAPITDEEVKIMANQILWFADPRLIKIIYKDESPVGFLLAYPDISAALQRNRGRLFPFGWIDVLRELRRTKWININGAGIVEQYRGLGGTALLFDEMYETVKETRYRFADLVQIGIENERMQRELRDLGIDFYKVHRVYQRAI